MQHSKKCLDDIAKAFQYELQNTVYKNKKIHISSLLRTTTTIKKLRRSNTNSVKNSSHLHGTTFDIDYLRYSFNENLNSFDVIYLKDILAKVLYKFKRINRCYVTFEKNQSCFHVVVKSNHL